MAYNRPSDFIPSHQREAVKVHIVYDIELRMSQIWEARTTAQTGDPCLLTQYQYLNSTSTLVTGSKESESTWDSSWDF